MRTATNREQHGLDDFQRYQSSGAYTIMFTFGSQYLRGLTPPREDWNHDLATMRELGFNTLRAWLVWGVLEPAPGEIDFDYLDEFLNACGHHDLKTGLLFHLHGCPEWAISRHRAYWYVGEDGQPFEPSARANTPSGGWPGLCPDHAEVQQMEAEFIGAVCAHVADRAEVAFWEPMNEPHQWIDLVEQPPGCFCYCNATRDAFRRWLLEKYGDLSTLGAAWGRRFSDWSEVRPPTWRFGFSDWTDWRTFTAESVAAHVRRRADVIRKHTRKPVIGHAWGGGAVSCLQLGGMAFDDWKNSAPLDMWGYSAFPETVEATVMVGLGTDFSRCAARGKEFWQSELGAGDCGAGLGRRGRVPPELLAVWCWESLRHGAQGLLFWQFRKEAHGSEFGAFGLTDYAGQPTENAHAVAAIGRLLHEHEAFFRAAQPAPAQVALLFSYQSYITKWVQYRDCHLNIDAISGYYRMLWEANIPVDIVHEEYLNAEALARYKAVILPMPVALHPDAVAPLQQFVRNGGTLLSDPYLCAFDKNKALSREVPGAGFAALFGCRERDLTTCGDRVLSLHYQQHRGNLVGGHLQTFWEPEESAQAIATYEDGAAAIVARRHGTTGRAVLSGVNLGNSYAPGQSVGDDVRHEAEAASTSIGKTVVLDILREAGVQAPVIAPEGVGASLLQAPDGRALLIAINFRNEPQNGALTLESDQYTSCERLPAGRVLPVHSRQFNLSLKPYESQVFLLS